LSSRRRRSPSLPSYSPSRSRLTATLFALTILLPSVEAYTWTFTSTPKQCGNLTISVSGSDGRPPYRVLILPFGPTPLAGNIEARRIMDMPFPNGGGSVGFQLKYPANSQFVAVVSMSFLFVARFLRSCCVSVFQFFSVFFSLFLSLSKLGTTNADADVRSSVPALPQTSPCRASLAIHRYHPRRSFTISYPSHPPLLEPMLHPICHSPVAFTTSTVDVDKDNPPTPSINSPPEAPIHPSSTDVQNYLSRHTPIGILHWNSAAAECRVLAPTLASRLTWISF